MSEEAFNEYLEKHQYRVILEDVTNIEDTENIMRMVGGDKSAAATEEVEEELSAEDLLNQTVSANASSVVEEDATGEEGLAEGGFDDFLEDDSDENK